MLQILRHATCQWLNNSGLGAHFEPSLELMKPFGFVALLALLAVTALAEPARNPQAAASQAGASQAASEQRRVELREALKVQRWAEHEAREQERAGSSPPRRLSAEERAELRQQLRQQGLEVKPARPGS